MLNPESYGHISENALFYLGAKNSTDNELKNKIEAAISDVEANSCFRATYRIFALDGLECPEAGVSFECEDMKTYLENCDRIAVMGFTLGLEYERFSRRLQREDMSYGIICDSTASAFLEELSDNYVKENISEPHTFRICPGYGDIPLGLNRPLAEAIMMHKRTGAAMTASGLFVPQKSMLCIVGIGNAVFRKNCGHCVRKDYCQFRKENTRCFTD